jgi:hypothetical protein
MIWSFAVVVVRMYCTVNTYLVWPYSTVCMYDVQYSNYVRTVVLFGTVLFYCVYSS